MIDKAYARKLAYSIFKDIFHGISTNYINDSQSRLISDFESERRNLLGEGVAKLWDKLMSNYKAYEQGRTLLVSEKALACLIRRGVVKKDITISGTYAHVQLSNYLYYIDKEGAGCSAGPFGLIGGWSRPPMRWIGLSGEDFADFMFDFDELVADCAKEVDDRLVNVKIKAKQYEILCRSIDGLGELFLKQSGIKWETDTDFTESKVPVTFSDGKHQPIYEIIPMDKLTDVFQSIPKRMNSQDILPKPRHGILPWWDDMESIFP